MKKAIRIILPILVAGAFLAGTDVQAKSRKKNKKFRLENAADSLSYIYGSYFGHSFNQMNISDVVPDFNISYFVDAFMETLETPETFNIEEATDYLNDYFMVRLPRRNMERSEQFLDSVKRANPRAQSTESGLLYEIIDPGNGHRATDDRDRVEVMYTGWRINGKVFDETNGEIRDFTLRQVIAGFAEGIKIIGEGGRIKLWIHPDLGYGARMTGQIQANDVLIFDVELQRVEHYQEEEHEVWPTYYDEDDEEDDNDHYEDEYYEEYEELEYYSDDQED